MKMHVISSGSKGNASLIYDDKTVVLVDLGISYSRLQEGLEEINKEIKDINFCLCTHEHSDHSKGVRFLDAKLWYTRAGTLKNISENHILEVFHEYHFGDITVTPLLISHDAIAPCGFLFQEDNIKIAYLTDSGYVPETTLKLIKNCDYYFFESNFDVDMLINSARPIFLKERILGAEGHLSNRQSATYLANLVGKNTKAIMLAHLSEECNNPKVALKTIKEIFKDNNISTRKIKISCAEQYRSVDLC